jgi:adenine-specific DNA-methyltransferase
VNISSALDLLNTRSLDGNEILSPVIRREDFIDQLFIFNNPSVEKILNKIEEVENFTLHNSEVAQGIVHPQDAINKNSLKILGEGFSLGDGIFVVNNDELQNLSLSDKEKTLIKPHFTSSELFQYHGRKDNKYWVIYTSSEFKNPEKFADYPNIKNHLDKFVKVITSGNKPYGLHRARNEKFFQGEKIISLRKCSNGPCFTYTDFDCYVSATFYVIKTEKINQKFLTGFLNSSLCKFWLRNKGKMQGSNYQIDKEPLINIPIPVIPQRLQDPVIGLVNQILNIKKMNPLEDISSLQDNLDLLFYNLYKLSEDDITIIKKRLA